ncbi:MAG: efflux RND transporter permease subunit [Bacteroides sp.]
MALNENNHNHGAIKRTSAFTLIVSFVCIALIGLAFIPLLPVKLNPSRTLPGFTVQYSMSGASSRVIEMEVTSKLEAMLSRIKGVKEIYSDSRNGWGTITITLDKHVDTDMVRFEASTIIRQVWPDLPDGVSYPVIRMKLSEENASRPFMSYTINAPATPILIQKYTEERIKSRLAQLPGIYKIEVTGATPMEWRLEYDSEQLRQLGVTLSEITSAIRLHYNKEFLGICNVESTGGRSQWMRLVLDSSAPIGVFDPKLIQIKNANGRLIGLDELVRVEHREEEPQNYYRINGLNSIYLFVTAEESANQLQLNKQISSLMAEIERDFPQGYEVHVSYDATEFIRGELSKIYLRTGLTIAILLLFVLVITLNARYLFLIVVSLAVNIAVAVIFYYLFNLEMQLYSLAGITVSLNLIIDNTIVMSDHYMRKKNRKAFMALLAATLTTIGALVIVFFLDEKIRLNLQDFAAVVMINLAVSLLVALFFVPALIDKIGLHQSRRWRGRIYRRRWMNFSVFHSFRHFLRRMPIYFTRGYIWLIRFTCRFRVGVFLLFLLIFGLPVFMLPEKLEGEGHLATLYNATFGSETYRNDFKPVVDKALGGTLRLFIEKVYDGSYFTRNEEVVLSVNANLPNGSTLEQMNTLIKRLETYLSEFKQIRQFQTSVYSANRASINIFFKKEDQKSGFPYTLKANIIAKSLQLGGGSWSVYGLMDQGFSNDIRENAGSFRVTMYGYNYDELYARAEEFKQVLLTHRRIKEVTINSEFSWWKDDYQEYYFNLNKEQMANQGITPYQLFGVLRPIFGRNIEAGRLLTDTDTERIKLVSRQSTDDDIWAMNYFPLSWNNRLYRLSELAEVTKGQTPQVVSKENQQYRLCLQYEYIGSSNQGVKILDRDLKAFNRTLPMGYSAEASDRSWGWGEKNHKQYALLGLIIAIIFVITSILFNSLRQPLAILFVIPISYVGVFLTFYWFELNFDQGGFASFILLCGITVNASIYIMNEYNSIRRRSPLLSPLRAYTKALNKKIIPIFLSVMSTILGFIPFMFGTQIEAFWFRLAAGTIGGLIMSVVGIFLFLPMMTIKLKTKKQRN